jgi:hypothetical protein
MPRRSPEAMMSAAYLRANYKPPKPPAGLGREAAALWRRITDDLPADRWDNAGALELLRQFCVTAIHGRRLEAARDAEPISSPEAARLDRRVIANSSLLATLGSKLRVTPQNIIDRHSVRLTPPGVFPHPIGGRPVGITRPWES